MMAFTQPLELFKLTHLEKMLVYKIVFFLALASTMSVNRISGKNQGVKI